MQKSTACMKSMAVTVDACNFIIIILSVGLTGGAIVEASAQVIVPLCTATHWHLIAAAASMNGSYCCSGHDSMMWKM